MWQGVHDRDAMWRACSESNKEREVVVINIDWQTNNQLNKDLCCRKGSTNQDGDAPDNIF